AGDLFADLPGGQFPPESGCELPVLFGGSGGQGPAPERPRVPVRLAAHGAASVPEKNVRGADGLGEYELWLWQLTGWTAQLAAAGVGVYLLLRAAFSRPPRW